MLVFVKGGNLENPEKNPQSNYARTNKKLNSLMMLGPGFEPGPHWWETCALTTVSAALHINIEFNVSMYFQSYE